MDSKDFLFGGIWWNMTCLLNGTGNGKELKKIGEKRTYVDNFNYTYLYLNRYYFSIIFVGICCCFTVIDT